MEDTNPSMASATCLLPQCDVPSHAVTGQELDEYKDRVMALHQSNTMEKVQEIMLKEAGIFAT